MHPQPATNSSRAALPLAFVELDEARVEVLQRRHAGLLVNVVQLEGVDPHIVELVVQDRLEPPVLERGHLGVHEIVRVVVDAQRSEGVVRRVVHARARRDLRGRFEVLDRVVLEEEVLAPRHLRAGGVVLVPRGAALAAQAGVLLVAEALRVERLEADAVAVAGIGLAGLWRLAVLHLRGESSLS